MYLEFISFSFKDPYEVASQVHTMGAPETLPTRPMEAWLTFVGPCWKKTTNFDTLQYENFMRHGR